MIDFTKEIQLNQEWGEKYVALRVTLHLGFLVLSALFIHTILFPTSSFNYTFGIVALKNTVTNPHGSQQESLGNGTLSAGKSLFFNTNTIGIFSEAKVTLTSEKDAPTMKNAFVKAVKSYQALFYPTGKPAGFKNGLLLSDGENQYLISAGLRRKFSSESVWKSLGLPQEAFTLITNADLSYNALGEDIIEGTFPDDLNFKIADTFYRLTNGQMVPYISDRAFETQFDPKLAIIESNDFLLNYTISENYLGFADSTLASLGDSVYVLSNGKSYPIVNPRAFNALGYNWDDIISISSEELSIYAKQRIFIIGQAHPDGTIFSDPKTGNFYLIKDKQKLPLKSIAIVKSYLKKNPILMEEKNLKTEVSCQLQKNLLPLHSYSCSLPISKLSIFSGDSYQFETRTDSDLKLTSLSVDFSTIANLQNAHIMLALIKNTLIENYTPKP